jgi:hypothetical protein
MYGCPYLKHVIGQAEGQTPGSQENTEEYGKLLINAGNETCPIA